MRFLALERRGPSGVGMYLKCNGNYQVESEIKSRKRKSAAGDVSRGGDHGDGSTGLSYFPYIDQTC